MKRRILIPIDQETPVDAAGSQWTENSNSEHGHFDSQTVYTPTLEDKETMNMNGEDGKINTGLFETAQEPSSQWETIEIREHPVEAKPVVEQQEVSEQQPGIRGLKSRSKFQTLVAYPVYGGTALERGPVASGQHLVTENDGFTRVNGDAEAYVHHNNMHLHGAIMQMGSSSSNAQQPDGYDPALGVSGFVPQAIEFIQKSARAANEINPLDRDGRPYQFGVITILGGSDHDKLTNALSEEPSPGLVRALEKLDLAKVKQGYRTTGSLRFVDLHVQMSPVLFNDLGYISAIEVRFTDTETYGAGKHYIYLHRANDIGGGKSDHSLGDGRTQAQARDLSNEFEWWKAALTLTGGRIGAIETTLGGTARVGRYALLHAKIPRTVYSPDTVETVLLDDAAWVKNNLGNMIQEYRANFATTMLRTVYGALSKRLNNVRVDLANRKDPVQRRLRQTTAIEAILRTLFPGVPALEPMFMDISDERTAIASQENITVAKQFTIHDPVETKPKGPWTMNRRTRVTAAISFSFGEVFDATLGKSTEELNERAVDMFEQVRGLASSVDNVLRPGGFCVLDMFVPTDAMADPRVTITSDMMQKMAQALTGAFNKAGSDKVLVHCHQVPSYLLPNPRRVYLRLTEDQPAHNMLLVSTHDAGVREKRTILTDPNLDIIEDPHYAHISAFARLFQQLIEGHEQSNYRFAEDDAHLLRAFYRHFFSNNFGSQPNLILGGSNRPLRK